MKLALIYGDWLLGFRGSLNFRGHRSDPRGLTGSEYGFIRTAQDLVKLGHDVTAYTKSSETEFEGIKIRPLSALEEIDSTTDAAVSFNVPDLLRDCKARLRVCEQFLNSFDYCQPGFHKHVDLWCSPSQGHLDMVLREPHDVGITPHGPAELYTADPANWVVIPLGCDPERYPVDSTKTSGRVVYCSSPDRGLHWLLQEWPAIKRAVPHATLKIFYRLQAWIDGFSETSYTPPIEALRSRAVYIQECLRRMSGPEWGITVCDSVSREQIEAEMCAAEVLAYPCDTTRWSEGFSCTILEACAARACPVITDCDALGGIYMGHCPVFLRADLSAWHLSAWRDGVIEALKNDVYRAAWNDKARAFAETLTWKKHAAALASAVSAKLSTKPSGHQFGGGWDGTPGTEVFA